MLVDFDRLTAMMDRQELDAMIVFSPEDVYYASGYEALEPERTLCAVIASREPESTLLVPKSDVGFITEDCWVRDRRTYGKYYIETPLNVEKEYGSLVQALADVCREKELQTKRIGLGGFGLRALGGKEWEELSLPPLNVKLQKELPRATLVNDYKVFRELRMIKSEEEVSRISKAVEASERAFMRAYESAKEGISELELVAALKEALARQNAKCMFVEMGGGIRSSLPTHPSHYRIRMGDLVHFDVGVRREGYCSDIARNAVLGNPSEKQRKVHEALFTAHREAVRAIRPGTRMADVFNIGQEEVRKAGFPQFWRHHIGHGIGIEPHEPPSINPHSTEVFKPGMTITVEIPYYIADVGGFNLEDVILVTEDGCESISTLDKQLYELPL